MWTVHVLSLLLNLAAAQHGFVFQGDDKKWVPAPAGGLRIFTPTTQFLESSAMAFGLPHELWARSLPFTIEEQESIHSWQFTQHDKLERDLGFEVTGFVTHADSEQPPLLIQELPGVVGTQIWAGEWLLWGMLSHELLSQEPHSVRNVLEVGAGCGLCGILLASQGFDVIVSDTSSGYDGAEETWMNLVFNAQSNEAVAKAAGGRITALDLDWTRTDQVPQVDLTIGADLIYDPQLCASLFQTIRQSSANAILIQNVARAGTEKFRALCMSECSEFRSSSISFAELEGSIKFPAARGWMDSFPSTDGRYGRYEVWHLTFPACSSSTPPSSESA